MKVANWIQILVILNILFNAINQTIGETPPLQQPNPKTQPPQTLKIIVPVSAYKEYVNFSYNVTGKPNFEGFSIKVFKTVIQSVYPDNPPTITFQLYDDNEGNLNGSFDSMIEEVYDQVRYCL